MADNVNHPQHYEKSCSLECIDVMEATFGKEYLMHFCLLNAFKYLWRHKNKNGAEDLEKARWYLEKIIDVNSTMTGDCITKEYGQAAQLFELYEKAVKKLDRK